MSVIWKYYEAFLLKIEKYVVDDLINTYQKGPEGLTINVKDFEFIEKNNLNKNTTFYSKENFYLRLIDHLKKYITVQPNHFVQFLEESIQDVKILSDKKKTANFLNDFLTKLEYWRRTDQEFQLIVSLLVLNDKRLIRLYLRYRVEVLKYRKQEIKLEFVAISNHNLNKYSKQIYQINNISMAMDTWSIVMTKLFEGTKYESKTIFNMCLQFVRDVLKKDGTLDMILKIKAVKFIQILVYLSTFKQQIFQQIQQQSGQKQKNLVIIKQENPETIVKQSRFIYKKDLSKDHNAVIQNLIESQKLRISAQKHKTQIEDIIIPESHNEKKCTDYSYRINNSKENAQKNVNIQSNQLKSTRKIIKETESKIIRKSATVTEMNFKSKFQEKPTTDPLIADLRKFVNTLTRTAKVERIKLDL